MSDDSSEHSQTILLAKFTSAHPIGGSARSTRSLMQVWSWFNVGARCRIDYNVALVMDEPAGRSDVEAERREARRGLLALLAAFSIWGVIPLYLRLLQPVPALQITAHRLVFCCGFVVGFLQLRGAFGSVQAALRERSIRRVLLCSAALITINWAVFVWSVANGRVVESSLGYFINPLVNVVLGVVVLGERLRRPQWIAVLLAATGVAYLTWLARAPPWIALSLALSFGAYGLLRKTVAVDAMPGLAAETLLLLPLGLGYLVACELAGTGVLARGAGAVTLSLLAGSGVLTAIPLWLFSFGTRRVRYATVGLVQYVGPSLQLLGGVFVFEESFALERGLGFAFIWAALAVYAIDGLRQR